MAYYYDPNSAAQYAMQLLRGQMVTQIISGQAGQFGGIGGMSLNEFMLGKPEKPKRSGTDIMNDALTGLIRSDAGMLRQASKNMNEGGALVKIASKGLKNIDEKLTRMQDIIDLLRDDTSQKNDVLISEYNDLAQGVAATVSNTDYNGIKLLDGSAWDSDERVSKNADGNTGKISLQAGKESTDLTLFNLEGLKTGLNPLVYPNTGDQTTWEARLNRAESMVDSASSMVSGMRQSYEARSGLYASEANFYERQAGILEEAAKRSRPNDEQSLKDAILDILLRDQGGLFDRNT
ncbi:MAG: hypothetical protein LBV80_05680 [Deltaproteobacteria bacterium]|jgi:flagellin|nr:hypothetical protein [Deltaproteobacteria bacterium]